MTKNSVECRASCPKCFGPLRRVVEGEIGDHRQWKVCDFCGAEYGSWVEKQWEEPTSEPDVAYEGEPQKTAMPGQYHEIHKTKNGEALAGCSSMSEKMISGGAVSPALSCERTVSVEDEVKMCVIVVDELNLSCARNVAGCEAASGVVQYRYSKMGQSCLKYVIVDVSRDGREEYAEQEAGEVRWYSFVPSAADRAALHKLIAAGETDDPWPLIIPIEDASHVPERGCSREWLFEVVEYARRGNERAKSALLLILETERDAIVVARLLSADLKWQDVRDAHHDVVVRVGERIEQLRATRAYFKWESRIINDVCKKYRRGYWRLAALREGVDSELAAQTQFVGVLDEELY